MKYDFTDEQIEAVRKEVWDTFGLKPFPEAHEGIARLILQARAERDLAIREVGNIGAKLGRVEHERDEEHKCTHLALDERDYYLKERDEALGRVRELEGQKPAQIHRTIMDAQEKRIAALEADFREAADLGQALGEKVERLEAENAELKTQCLEHRVHIETGISRVAVTDRSKRIAENERLRVAFDKALADDVRAGSGLPPLWYILRAAMEGQRR